MNTKLCLEYVHTVGDIEFSNGTITATFVDGMTMSNVNISINNSVEASIGFNLILDVPSSLGPAIRVGGRDRALGIIISNSNSECLEFIIYIYIRIRMYVHMHIATWYLAVTLFIIIIIRTYVCAIDIYYIICI